MNALDTPANIDPAERDHFSALAARWWDHDGPMRTLHDINPVRLAYVEGRRALAGLRAADIGCGGGLLCEAMATRGAMVTGTDASLEVIEVARQHAAANGLDIDYRAVLSAQMARELSGRFDLVTCMELLEHVPDPEALLDDCAALLVPGGDLFVSTLNRTPTAYLLGIVAAERVLDLVPRGTHDYAQFIKPSELAAAARQSGFEVIHVQGMVYNPVTRRARLTGRPRVNYLAHLRRLH